MTVKHDRPRLLLAVRMEGSDHDSLKSHALQIGERMGCGVVLLTLVHGKLSPQTNAGKVRMITPNPNQTAVLSPEVSRLHAQSGNGPIECTAHMENLSAAVSELTQRLKRIEFILTDATIVKDHLTETGMTPVFRIMTATSQTGGRKMSKQPKAHRAPLIGKTIFLGAVSAALYAAVFWKADLVMQLFTRGGLFAALPIATVFAFSFAHGAFASNLWSLLGIQARSATAEPYKSVAADARPAKAKTKRPRAHAYVNTFHNLDLRSK